MNKLIPLVTNFTSNLRLFVKVWIATFFVLVIFTFLVKEQYQSEMILSPTEDSKGELQSIGSAGALASLAGIALETDVSRSTKAISKMRSKSFFIELIESYGDELLVGIVAARSYNKSKNQLNYRKSIYNSGIWYGDKEFNIFDEVFVDNAYEKYIRMLRINENRLSGLITVNFRHVSPNFSYRALSMILEQINESARVQDKTEAEYAINFLSTSFNEYGNEPLRKSASILLERQLKIIMLANSKKSYLLETLDGPHVPVTRYFPSRTITVLMGEILISVLLYLYLFFKESILSFFREINAHSS